MQRRRRLNDKSDGEKDALVGEDGKKVKISRKQLKVGLRKLLKLARPETGLLTIGFIALIITSSGFVLLPRYVGNLVDVTTLANNTLNSNDTMKSKEMLTATAVTIAGLGVVVGAAAFVRGLMFELAGERIVKRTREVLFQAILSQEIGFFDENTTGKLMSRITADTQFLQSALTTNLSILARNVIQFFASLAFLFVLSWKLTLMVMSVLPPLIIAIGYYYRFYKKIQKKRQDLFAEASNVAEESIGNIRTVRSFGCEELETVRYEKAMLDVYKTAKKLATLYGLFQAIAGFAGLGIVAAALWVGGTMVIEKQMTIGDLVSFLIYSITIGSSFGILLSMFSTFAQAIGANERVFQVIDRIPEMESGHQQPPAGIGLLEFHDVHFSYPARPEVKVLKGLSLRLEPGKTVALCGKSGGGKSTIFNLCQRLYDPAAGTVALDGIDLRMIDTRYLRSCFASVMQEPSLFSSTIKENIRYGKATATDEEIEAAAKKSNAFDFIKEFPEQFDTVVGERGVRLSGGQKQRVAIARALVRNPQILLLDEATSALDAESEKLVQDALDNLMVGRTVLMIAHRLSTIREADTICVINGGEVVEFGPHDELIAREGAYAKLVNRQLSTEDTLD